MQFIVLALLTTMITGCASYPSLINTHDSSSATQEESPEELRSSAVVYVLPKSMATHHKGVYGLVFPSQRWGIEDKQEKILQNFNSNILNIERRTDNGFAGSGRKYVVHVSGQIKPDHILVTLDPSTYMKDTILPFNIPAFDIASYLSSP